MSAKHNLDHEPIFWRDARMPYVELRKVIDGRKVCYALHSHTQYSIGAITWGESTFLYHNNTHHVEWGDLVLINPQWPHACNPIDDKPWSYLMLYIDSTWLSQLRYNLGMLKEPKWQDIAQAIISNKSLYKSFCAMAECLLDLEQDFLNKQIQVVDCLSTLMQVVNEAPIPPLVQTPSILKNLAAYLDEHYKEDITLENLCMLSGYSPSHLIRIFKQYFGMTPHSYLVNRRIQCSQKELKKGISIIDIALNTGFADQAHFQRTFKQYLAATPNQYRQSIK